MAKKRQVKRKHAASNMNQRSADLRRRKTSDVAKATDLEKATREAHPEFELRNEVIESALRTGEYQGLLEDYFGADNYAELRQLSREAAARGVRGGPKVFILPGIMGSTIGTPRFIGLFHDLYWFDPVDIAAGRLSQLALSGAANRFVAVGVMLITYLRLKLRLQIAGYDASFHPFDWRLSTTALGAQLVERLQEIDGDVDLVAHSMGGLVARAALAQGATCRRLIMLGTPNFGSFAPVMALRATYPVVRKVAALDLRHSAEDLARDVFSTFPGLAEMLPAPEQFSGLDLYDLGNWPADNLRPRADILRGVEAAQKGLAPGADNFYLIAGVDQRTVIGVRRDGGGQFAYAFSSAGDGTVPLDLARLPNIKATYYIAEAHGSLPNNRVVGRAVLDLLASGATQLLPDKYVPSTRAAAAETVLEDELRVDYYEGRRGGLLSQRELRHLLDEVASPDARDGIVATTALPSAATAAGVPLVMEPGYAHAFDQVVVGRRRQHRIDLRFAYGSITEVDTRAIALGLYRGVTPDGAASALDRRMDGAITELSRRRMFSSHVGEIFIMPTGRHPLTADLIAFVGLGDFDRFNDEVLQTAAENVIRTFINARVEEFATVLFGGGSGENPASALRNLLLGLFRGLRDADRDHRFRRIVVCEQDPERYVKLKEELYRLSSTALCADVELTFDEVKLRPPPEAVEVHRAMAAQAPVYLIVRQEQTSQDEGVVRSSLLTAGPKATVVSGSRNVSFREFEKVRQRITGDEVIEFSGPGLELGKMLLAKEVRTVLGRFLDRHLVVVHDAALSRVPWEVMAIEGNGDRPRFPAVENGLSHRYAADHLSVAKWLEERIHDKILNVLLVVNPTEDLDGAEEEGKRIAERLHGQAGVELEELRNAAATRPALLEAFTSGKYDVIHYAGHASFDERNPASSGLLCAGATPLTGGDLASLGNLPALVFFNACESGRVRLAKATKRLTRGERSQRSELRVKHLRESVGLAEAFMRGGIANFLGTYWPVGDYAAKTFADSLYTELLAGETIGQAIQAGRKAILPNSKDWANYVFYGDANFVLKGT
jgi:pimeloyl-ACP methyl ester carboxylesterase